jgi:hypothetical protein
MSLLNKDIITPDEASAIVLGAYQTTTAALPFASILRTSSPACLSSGLRIRMILRLMR